MLFIEPCLPTISRTVPTGSGWAYEIKHDGFPFAWARERCWRFRHAGTRWRRPGNPQVVRHEDGR